jgi:hypothetical protein
MNLLDMIMNAQNGDVVRQIATNFKLDERQARSAVGELVPALSRGISRNTKDNEQGLNDLFEALRRGDHGRYIEHPSVATERVAVEEGNGILGHIFGSKEVSRNVASHAAEKSGVDSSVLKKMLPVLASVAMGALAKNGFGSAAGGSPQGAGLGGLLSSFLDSDKDGSVLDDVIGMAGRLMR